MRHHQNRVVCVIEGKKKRKRRKKQERKKQNEKEKKRRKGKQRERRWRGRRVRGKWRWNRDGVFNVCLFLVQAPKKRLHNNNSYLCNSRRDFGLRAREEVKVHQKEGKRQEEQHYGRSQGTGEHLLLLLMLLL